MSLVMFVTFSEMSLRVGNFGMLSETLLIWLRRPRRFRRRRSQGESLQKLRKRELAKGDKFFLVDLANLEAEDALGFVVRRGLPVPGVVLDGDLHQVWEAASPHGQWGIAGKLDVQKIALCSIC